MLYHKKIVLIIALAAFFVVIVVSCLAVVKIEPVSAGGGAPSLDMEHYRWRNDDNNEASASFTIAENTATTSMKANDVVRLRVTVHNEGDKDANGVTIGIAYGTNSDCSNQTAVPVAGSCGADPFCMYDTQLVDGNDTTNVAGGLADIDGANFIAGEQVDNLGNSSVESIDDTPYEFTELEYGFQVTANATAGLTYYFGLSGINTHSRCAQLDMLTPEITVGTTGSQAANIYTGATSTHVGGAFTFKRNTGSDTVTSIVISETDDSFSANSNATNVRIRYETAGTCTYDGNETIFGSTAGFDGSENSTVSGSMLVGTDQICVYVELGVGPGASANETIEIEITDPSTEVSAGGTVAPNAPVAISGTTTVAEPTITVATGGTQTANLNVESQDNDIGGYFTFIANYGAATVTQIVISETNDVNANSNLSNVDIYYEITEYRKTILAAKFQNIFTYNLGCPHKNNCFIVQVPFTVS